MTHQQMSSPQGKKTRGTATQRAIAERCGVSQMTVSRVLRDDPSISAKTAALVLAAAKAMGYDPVAHDAARRMVLRRSGRRVLNHLVAIVLPEDSMKLNYFNLMFRGASQELMQAGFAVLFVSMPTFHEADPSKLPTSFRRGDIDGVILFNDVNFYASLNALHIQPPPTAFLIDTWVDKPDVTVVRTDDEAGAYQAMQHLLALGHRHFLHFLHSGLPEQQISRTTQRRLQGMERALSEYGLSLKERMHYLHYPTGWRDTINLNERLSDLYSADSSYRQQVKLFLDYLQAHPEITAIFGENDANALYAWYTLTRAGYTIPQDYSLIGFDDTDPMIDEQGRNLLTTVRLPLLDAGREAARLLLQAILHGEARHKEMLLPTEFIVRGSTMPPAR